ncbi:MAG: sodium-dependent transporter [Hyphomicrobiales bacterium]
MSKPREGFATKLGVIAAATGSAVGLGNIWRFPYVTGTNGGGAFISVYLLCIIFVGLPALISAYVIGRRAQKNAIGAFKFLAPKSKWYLFGVLGLIGTFLVLAFYSQVAGWTLQYIFFALKNTFQGLNSTGTQNLYNTFIHSGTMPIVWQVIFIILTGLIVLAGVQNGIEKYSKILMPVLVIILIIMDIKALTLPDFHEGYKFLFKPDFSKIDKQVIINAMGQGFFTLSVGLGTMLIYGSYIKKKDHLISTSVQVAFYNTIISILAGLAIFPAVFSYGISPSSGSGLAFITLPSVFQDMTGGYIFALLFFILLGIAALTSTISMLETIVGYFTEELHDNRRKVTLIITLIIIIISIPTGLSVTGALANFKVFGYDLFDAFNFLVSNIIMPIGGLSFLLFVGWYMKKKDVRDELSSGGRFKAPWFNFIYYIIKFLSPILVIIVFLSGLGII